MELNELGVGSIVEAHGNLYKKRRDGWAVLEETMHAYMGGVQEFKVVASVEKGPLDDFVEGDVISFEGRGGVRVATKHRDDIWQVTGAMSMFTSVELIGFILDEGSVRKVGSISGRS